MFRDAWIFKDLRDTAQGVSTVEIDQFLTDALASMIMAAPHGRLRDGVGPNAGSKAAELQ